jgi:hypothetical protein
MPTIDLTTPPPAPEGTLESLPRRVALTLPELRTLAHHAGDAPLPFDVAEPATAGPLEHRLGETRGSGDSRAYADAVAGLHDPTDSLTRRGLLDGTTVDPGVAGAVGLLATPAVAVDLDVVVDGLRARAWHRQRGDAVATLATIDGMVFELAWFEAAAWPGELARVATLPDETEFDDSAAPDPVDLPYELLDAGAEAVRAGRQDLLPTIIAHHQGEVRGSRGTPLPATEVAGLIGALVGESRGRLRALVADVEAGVTEVGVVSWVLLADGWRALRPHQVDGVRRVEIRRVESDGLPAELGPVLAEVTA